MQNKGAIKLIALLMAIVCLYHLSFTFFTKNTERKAREYAKDKLTNVINVHKENAYLDSMAGQVIYNIGLKKFTYKDCKERELNLGLDLKGGMNVVLEISMVDIVRVLSNYSQDSSFNKALNLANQNQKSSTKDFITLFGEAYKTIEPNGRLCIFFNTLELKDKINLETSDAEVISILKKEAESAFNNSFNVLRSRIDRFGVTQPNIQKLENSNRILIELPGIKDPQRVRKLLQGTASLEFWATYDNKDIYPALMEADKLLKVLVNHETDTVKNDSAVVAKADTAKKKNNDLLDIINKNDTSKNKSVAGNNQSKDYPLLSILMPNAHNNQLQEGSIVGYAHFKDTSKVNEYLNMKQVRALLPKDARFVWSIKYMKEDKSHSIYELHAIRVTTRDGRPQLTGSVITSANKAVSQNRGGYEVEMSMNTEGMTEWARMTKDNVGKCIAIVLDNYVYSAPRVQNEIKGGNSQITGNFTTEEAEDLANVLKSGKLPAPAKIVQEAIVGPSLGEKSIHDGMISFIIALVVVILFMWVYYSKAGFTANVALMANVFLIFGTLSAFGAVLTLPGIAGIVLTLGMAVDANILIYERIREELRNGKQIKNAVADGYKHAMPAIIDSNFTHVISGVALYMFGTGPIQGFATTLIIGVLTSLFTAIFISRIIFEGMLKSGKSVSLGNRFTMNVLVNPKIDFIGIRKYFYVFSCILVTISIISFFTHGFNLGLQFKGGHDYTIKFPQTVNTLEIQKALAVQFDNNTPEVKTFGNDNQVRVATKYMIDDPRPASEVDSILNHKIYDGLKQYTTANTTFEQFKTDYIIGSEKVGPTIADDIKRDAVLAVLVALFGIFIFILIRFSGWRFGLGGVISLAHDTIIVLGAYSLLYNVMPFSLEIDQEFIAAILTVIGYSINDTVIIYDRIREYRREHTKWKARELFNGAFNSTLSRTINTSLTVLFVLIIIFIFGGEVIRGFVFAMLLGIGVGTYSSIFNAAAIVYDLLPEEEKAGGELQPEVKQA